MSQSFNIGLKCFQVFEKQLDRCFTQNLNPLYHLGALGFYFFWIVAVTGLYLYAFFDTSITGAYTSVESITNGHFLVGSIVRSLHRYASDAMVMVFTLHMLRELSMGRFRGARWFSWITGVPLIWLIFASGINGYWLVWDERAQYVAIVTSEWLDWLPVFTTPMAQNFLNEASLSDRFFSLLSFLHIGIPLFLLFLMWVHVQRMAMAKTNPPKGLALGTLLALVLLSLVKPATSMAPANLDRSVTVVEMDWFYMNLYPLLDSISPGDLWGIAGMLTLLIAGAPFVLPRKDYAVARVHLPDCNGCERCFADCPYDAVVMQPRSDGSPYAQEATVNESLCVGCGICVGACPTATPFRRHSELKAGIEMADYALTRLRQEVHEGAESLDGRDRVFMFSCGECGIGHALSIQNLTVITLPCIAMLPPPFIDYILSKNLADGIFLTGCEPSNCYSRYGSDWMEKRITRVRDPYLRARVPIERVKRLWSTHVSPDELQEAVLVFQKELQNMGQMERNYVEIKNSLSFVD